MEARPAWTITASDLRETVRPTTFAGMISRRQWRKFMDHPVVEWTLFTAGIGLIVVGCIVAPLPGPGGVFFIVPGLALVLKTSMWAKRYYVRFKRWQPKAGRWADWGLRRRSALRREALRKGETPPNVETGN